MEEEESFGEEAAVVVGGLEFFFEERVFGFELRVFVVEFVDEEGGGPGAVANFDDVVEGLLILGEEGGHFVELFGEEGLELRVFDFEAVLFGGQLAELEFLGGDGSGELGLW